MLRPYYRKMKADRTLYHRALYVLFKLSYHSLKYWYVHVLCHIYTEMASKLVLQQEQILQKYSVFLCQL